jgi:hypothetical protein
MFPISKMHGSDGIAEGRVYFQNRGLQVSRRYVIPAYKHTDPQEEVREYFTLAAQAFGALSDSQRATWDDYAARHKEEIHGVEYQLGAMACFERINAIRQIDAQTLIQTAPTTDPDWRFSEVNTVAFASGTGTLTFKVVHNKSVPGTEKVMVKVSPTLNSAQRHSRENERRLASSVLANSIVALPASGQTLTVTTARFVWVNGEYMDIALTPLNAEYSMATEFLSHQTITVS